MANQIQQQKIYSKTGLAAGTSQTVTWKNPPQETPLSFWAAANPPGAPGPHGTSHGAVEITGVVHHYDRDNYNGDRTPSTSPSRTSAAPSPATTSG